MQEVPQPELRSRGNWLDRLIYAVAPRWGAQRMFTRRMQDIADQQVARMSSGWKGNNDDRLHADKWLASRLSPDSGLETDLPEMRRNSNELYRGYAFCHGAINTRVDNVVGNGFRYQSQVRAVKGIITEEEAQRFNTEIEAVMQRWQKQAGRAKRSFGQLQRIAVRSRLRDGDILRVFSDVGRADKPVPLQVNLIDANRIETPPGESGNPRVRMGVRYDDKGDVLGYYTRKVDPDDTLDSRVEEYDFWPADRAQLIYEPLWESQSRGVPWFAPIRYGSKDWKDFKQAVIVAAQTAACQTLIIGTSNPAQMAANAPGVETNANGDYEEPMQPGQIRYRHNADTIEQFNPTQPSTTFGMFAEYNMMEEAAGLNWPVTWYTKDYRRVNFISGRLGEIDGRMVIRADQQLLTETLLDPTADRVVREAVILGAVSIDPSKFDRYPHLFLCHRWIGPGRPWVDTKEVAANVLAKEHNIDTLANIHSRLGLDSDEVFSTRGREKKAEKEHDVEPPVQNGKPAEEVGMQQSAVSDQPSEEGGQMSAALSPQPSALGL